MNLKVKFYGLLTCILMPFLLLVQMCDPNHETETENKAISKIQTEKIALK